MEKITAIDPEGVEWTYLTEEERDGDGFSYDDHYAVSATGERRILHWSRFDYYRREHFVRFIEAGMPRSPTIGNWHPEDIMALEAA